MEAKENWISPEGYSLNINHLNQDMIVGDFKISLSGNDLFIPFEGLINICHGNQMEFCFIVDWHFYVTSGTCYTSFAGKNYFDNDVEYLSLKWLLVHEIDKPEKQNLSIRGKNKFIKVSKEINNLNFANGSDNLPYPFFIDVIKTKVGTERYGY